MLPGPRSVAHETAVFTHTNGKIEAKDKEGFIVGRRQRRSIMSEQLKNELAKDLGFYDTIQKEGWGGIKAKDAGNMVKRAIQLAEQAAAKQHAQQPQPQTAVQPHAQQLQPQTAVQPHAQQLQPQTAVQPHAQQPQPQMAVQPPARLRTGQAAGIYGGGAYEPIQPLAAASTFTAARSAGQGTFRPQPGFAAPAFQLAPAQHQTAAQRPPFPAPAAAARANPASEPAGFAAQPPYTGAGAYGQTPAYMRPAAASRPAELQQ